MKKIHVTLTVNIDGQEKTFTSAVATDGDLYKVATANVNGVANSATEWLGDLRYGPRSKGGLR